MISNGEFNPLPQTPMGTYFSDREFSLVEGAENAFHSPQQRQVEAHIQELADKYGARQGLDRRQFLSTSCGMAAAFVAMNKVFGPIYDVSEAEAADPARAAERREALRGQFIFDDQTHFIRDDFQYEELLGLGQYARAVLEPGVDPGRTDQPLLLQVRELRPANLLEQRHLGGGVERSAV
jgi:hypothetical protein